MEAPGDPRARAALAEHLAALRDAAGQLGFVQLERSLRDALERLEREMFSAEAVGAVRALAGQYASLAAIPSPPIRAAEDADETEPKDRLRGRQVLVAIEHAPTRWSYVGILRDAGARVIEARDGAEALELARQRRPDLILAETAMARLDGLGLCAAVRRERSLDDVPFVLLSFEKGEVPRALSEPGAGSHRLVDALLEALLAQGAIEPDAEPDDGASSGRYGLSGVSSVETRIVERVVRQEPERESVLMSDPLERENIRAQSAVSMHREPRNRGASWSYPIWRLNLGASAGTSSWGSGFEMQLDVISRLLGIGFLALLAGTAMVLLWSEWAARMTSPAVSRAVDTPDREPAPIAAPSEPDALPPAEPSPSPVDPKPSPDRGLSAFSGTLRADVDPSLQVAEGQGVLELLGPGEVAVEIDGVDRGRLPVVAVLDEGRHAVRYRVGPRATYRFYVVEAGATRALRVVTQPGGFVDAR